MSKIMGSTYDNHAGTVVDAVLLAVFITGAVTAAMAPEAVGRLPLGVCVLACLAMVFLLSLCVSGVILIPVCTFFFGGVIFALCGKLYGIYSAGAADNIVSALVPLIAVPAYFLAARIAMRTSAATFSAMRTSQAYSGVLKAMLIMLIIIAPAVISTMYSVI